VIRPIEVGIVPVKKFPGISIEVSKVKYPTAEGIDEVKRQL